MIQDMWFSQSPSNYLKLRETKKNTRAKPTAAIILLGAERRSTVVLYLFSSQNICFLNVSNLAFDFHLRSTYKGTVTFAHQSSHYL